MSDIITTVVPKMTLPFIHDVYVKVKKKVIAYYFVFHCILIITNYVTLTLNMVTIVYTFHEVIL